jgi:hypothetical protein
MPRIKQTTIKARLRMAENGWPLNKRASGGRKTARM